MIEMTPSPYSGWWESFVAPQLEVVVQWKEHGHRQTRISGYTEVLLEG